MVLGEKRELHTLSLLTEELNSLMRCWQHCKQCVGTCQHRKPSNRRFLETGKGDKISLFLFKYKISKHKFCMKVRCCNARD